MDRTSFLCTTTAKPRYDCQCGQHRHTQKVRNLKSEMKFSSRNTPRNLRSDPLMLAGGVPRKSSNRNGSQDSGERGSGMSEENVNESRKQALLLRKRQVQPVEYLRSEDERSSLQSFPETFRM